MKKSFFPFLVYFCCLVVTYFAWQYVYAQNENTVRQKFKEDISDAIKYQVKERIDIYAGALYSFFGFTYFEGNSADNQANWNKLVGRTRILAKYPSVVSVAFVDKINGAYAARYVKSSNDKKTEVVSYLLSQSSVKVAMDKMSGDSLPVATQLFRFSNGSNFAIILPLYRDSASTTIDGQNGKIVDFVLAVVDSQIFFKDTIKNSASGMSVEIVDFFYKNGTLSRTLFYDSDPSKIEFNLNDKSKLRVISPINVAGRTWKIYQSAPLNYGLSKMETVLPALVLFLGLVISWLFAGILYSLLTAKTRAEEIASVMTKNLRQSEGQLSTILYSIADGVFVVDKKRRITLINQAAAVLSGVAIGHAFGQNYAKVFQFTCEINSQKSTACDFIEKTLTSGKEKASASHIFLLKKDGTKLFVSPSVAPLKNSDGKTSGCVVVLRDTTAERKVEKMKDEFISLASHQLRTPLTAIKLLVEMLMNQQAGKLSSKQFDYMDKVHQSTDRMVRLVNDLLNVSRIETGRLKIEAEPIQLDDMVKDLVTEFRPVAKERDCRIIFDRARPKTCLVKLDTTLIRQVIGNLLSNAIRYSWSPKSHVWVKIESDKKGDFIISVRDEGIGIELDAQARIFEKFFRTGQAVKAAANGSGLGLYMAKMVMKASGGDVWFVSPGTGKGSTFYVKIPKLGMRAKSGEKSLSLIK